MSVSALTGSHRIVSDRILSDRHFVTVFLVSLVLIAKFDRLFAQLLLGTIVHRLADNRPPTVQIGQIATENWCSRSESHHNRTHRRKLIVQGFCLVQIGRLESDLQTGRSHTEL